MKLFLSLVSKTKSRFLSLRVMQTWSLVSISVLLAVLVRWGVSLNSYSGRERVNLHVNYTKLSGLF